MRSGGKIAHRVIERGHVDGNDLAVIRERQIEIDHVAQHREIGAIELQDESGLDDRLVFAPHHVGERVNVFLIALVVAVLEIARDLAGRGRGHEIFFSFRAGERVLGELDIGLGGGPVLPGDRAGAGRAVLERRGEVLEDFRELGEFRLAGAERRRTFAFVAGQAIEHMHGVVGAALLAVIDDVEAAFGLLSHD